MFANKLASIVAVHGLSPLKDPNHAEDTWTAKASRKMWLRDFLPHKIPNARIMLFGYNSNAAFSTSAAGVQDQAEVLFSRLIRERRSAPDRPLIFICHSLGGLIVKRVGNTFPSPLELAVCSYMNHETRHLSLFQESTIDSSPCIKQHMD